MGLGKLFRGVPGLASSVWVMGCAALLPWLLVLRGSWILTETSPWAQPLFHGVYWPWFGACAYAISWLRRSKTLGKSMGLGPLSEALAEERWDDAVAVAMEMDPQLAEALEGRAAHYKRCVKVLHEQMQVVEEIQLGLGEMAVQLGSQDNVMRQFSEAIDESFGHQKSIGQSLDGLSHSAEESSSSILQMVAINNEVRENVHNLALSVQETTTAIEEMTFSSKEVAKNIEELSTAAEETAASMNEMDVSISQVETNANETSELSDTVTTDAATGVAAINKTIQGIDDIKDSSRIAADVITNLGLRISEIGNILNVIDDVAEQTNLLALNAAIIAAQAGEHGRGFAVVADEIKALAERTGASTKEIADLVKTIQDQSRNAISVMARGVDDVDQGVRLGHNAEDALRKIVDSAKRSTLMIQAIAQATVEQAKGSKQVTNAISRIAETVQQIAFATAEQAKGSEHIMQSAERMKVITQQVERSADEQNRGGRQITQAIENIREMAEQISEVQRQQASGAEGVTSAAEKARRSRQTLHEQMQELEEQHKRHAKSLATIVHH